MLFPASSVSRALKCALHGCVLIYRGSCVAIESVSDINIVWSVTSSILASIAQLGERQTEDLKVPGSIPGRGSFCFVYFNSSHVNEI